MAIIWCGGEDIDFPSKIGHVVTTNASYFRTGYARSALGLGAYDNYVETPAFTSMSNLWFSCRFCIGDNRSSQTFLKFRNGASDILYVSYVQSGAVLTLGKTGTGVIASGSSPIPISSVHKLDICIQDMDQGSSGSMKLWVNGQLEAQYTGSLASGSITSIDRVRPTGGGSIYFGTYWSELIVADEDTRLFSLLSMYPNATGSVNTFSSGMYTDIDEASLSDADTLYSATPDQDAQFGLSDIPAGNFICKGVRVSARCADGVGGMGMQVGLQTSGSLFLGDTRPLSGAWETITGSYPQNPNTLNRWTIDELNALQIAFRSKTVP